MREAEERTRLMAGFEGLGWMSLALKMKAMGQRMWANP
jgi:hypothetical protein